MIRRFDVYLVDLDAAPGAKAQKARPCVVVSPDEIHRNLHTAIVAPLTKVPRGYPTRVGYGFADNRGEVACDQIRTVDQSRLIQHLGRLDGPTAAKVARTLVQMFS